MPVPLPNEPVGLPALPPASQDPPTLTDIANAVAYTERLRASYGATQTEVGEGAVYEAAIVAEHAGAAVVPAWFAPALAAGLAGLVARVSSVEARVNSVETRLDSLTRTANIAYNILSGDGHARPFKVVPFPDGAIPTAQPHNLPALVNLTAINTLTEAQATAYLNGYHVHIPPLLADRKCVIRVEVGCTAEF